MLTSAQFKVACSGWPNNSVLAAAAQGKASWLGETNLGGNGGGPGAGVMCREPVQGRIIRTLPWCSLAAWPLKLQVDAPWEQAELLMTSSRGPGWQCVMVEGLARPSNNEDCVLGPPSL